MNDKALVSEERVELAARIVCQRAGESWDQIGEFAQGAIKDTQRAALQAALGVGGWRPIAEAPRDKQFFAADMHFDIGIAYWHKKNPYWGIPDRYEWVTSGWGDSPPPVYYLPSPPPSSEEG